MPMLVMLLIRSYQAILDDAVLDFPCVTLKGTGNVLDEDKQVKEDSQHMESTTVQESWRRRWK